MKGLLIFLAVAAPVVLLSPTFWSIVRMNTGAERIGYVHKTSGGGSFTQWATLGPKAPWPQWALVPEGAKLTVGANFEAAPGFDAVGYGEVDGKAPPRAVVERYRAALRQAGWNVRAGRFDSMYPEVPPRPLHWCIVEGRRGRQVQQMSVDIAEPRTVGRLHWAVGNLPFPAGATDQPCWR